MPLDDDGRGARRRARCRGGLRVPRASPAAIDPDRGATPRSARSDARLPRPSDDARRTSSSSSPSCRAIAKPRVKPKRLSTGQAPLEIAAHRDRRGASAAPDAAKHHRSWSSAGRCSTRPSPAAAPDRRRPGPTVRRGRRPTCQGWNHLARFRTRFEMAARSGGGIRSAVAVQRATTNGALPRTPTNGSLSTVCIAGAGVIRLRDVVPLKDVELR